ncbi:protein FRG2-like isoform X2 [Tamandua tetradactyla]|uniref:protein FRG2-like isoform X2 n=1 Tax=Tamandua tetradactyla TaxID=48850 RepID=UPI0040538410
MLGAGGSSLVTERSMTFGRKKRKASSYRYYSKIQKRQDACLTRHSRSSPGRSMVPESQTRGDQPPPLRKSLVSFLRALSESIHQDMVEVWAQQVHSPLTLEQLSALTYLRGSLCFAAQKFYAMATQAAYGFPAEAWLIPAQQSDTRVPVKDGDVIEASSVGQGVHSFHGESGASTTSGSD